MRHADGRIGTDEECLLSLLHFQAEYGRFMENSSERSESQRDRLRRCPGAVPVSSRQRYLCSGGARVSHRCGIAVCAGALERSAQT